jgi:hypothetical protein
MSPEYVAGGIGVLMILVLWWVIKDRMIEEDNEDI